MSVVSLVGSTSRANNGLFICGVKIEGKEYYGNRHNGIISVTSAVHCNHNSYFGIIKHMLVKGLTL